MTPESQQVIWQKYLFTAKDQTPTHLYSVWKMSCVKIKTVRYLTLKKRKKKILFSSLNFANLLLFFYFFSSYDSAPLRGLISIRFTLEKTSAEKRKKKVIFFTIMLNVSKKINNLQWDTILSKLYCIISCSYSATHRDQKKIFIILIAIIFSSFNYIGAKWWIKWSILEVVEIFLLHLFLIWSFTNMPLRKLVRCWFLCLTVCINST